MAGDDFVMVQLSPAGVIAAQGGPLRVSNGRRAFTFTAGVPQRVERSYEWFAVLRNQHTPKGDALFELAPVTTAAAAPVAAAPDTKAPVTAVPVTTEEEKH